MTKPDRGEHSFFPTYKRLPLDVERGEGVRLFTRDGRVYLDMFAGLAVNALGYGHPAVLAAIERQIHRYLHLSNFFLQDVQVELAERLLAAARYDRLFLCNSGTEAMEAALKLARRWGKGCRKSPIFGLTGSFHGRTLGALSVTGREKYRQGFDPFLPETQILGFNNVEELRRAVNDRTLAVVLEFIQGEGGIHPVSREYLAALTDLRNRYGFLIIADETQSGIGRTGRFFGFEHFDFRPDIVVAAKAIGGGLPLGAMMAAERFSETFTGGTHGSTFGGNPVACAAGVATLRAITEQGVMEHAASAGAYLKSKLESVARELPRHIREVRGFGLMLGVELQYEGSDVVARMLDGGVLVNLTNSNVVRWLPSLVVKNNDIDEAVSVFRSVLSGSNLP